MAENEAKLTVAVPRRMAEAIDDAARDLSITRSDVVRRAIDAFLKEQEKEQLMAEFARGYASMTAEARREYEAMAEEGAGGAHEALRSVIGSEDEEPWW